MRVNDRIIQSRVLLFLGAGASSPFGGWLMEEFVSELKNRVRNEGEELFGLLQTLVDYTKWDLEAILKELGDISEKRYFSDKSRINYVNDFLDSDEERETRALEREKLKAATGRPTSSYVGTVEEIPEFSKRYSQLVEMCKELRNIIEKLIFEHYGGLEHSLSVKIYKPLFNILLQHLGKDRILPIFTTNYDCIIEKYEEAEHKEIRLVDGFREASPRSRELLWDRTIFDDFRAEENKLSIILFKLHGSINWYETTNGKIIYSAMPIHQEKRSRYKNVLIYPAMNKIAIHEPYFTGYDYFQRCLDNGKFGIFIGYSFRDYDTVTKIRSALNFNKDLALFVLDPNAKELIANNFSSFEKRFTALEYYFGREALIEKYLEQLKKALEK